MTHSWAGESSAKTAIRLYHESEDLREAVRVYRQDKTPSNRHKLVTALVKSGYKGRGRERDQVINLLSKATFAGGE